MKASKQIISLLLTLCLFCSIAVSAFAANVTDEVYYKDYVAVGDWGGSGGRYKENNSKVYVYPSSSPAGATKVTTCCYVATVATNKTNAAAGYVTLQDGQKYAITNWVYEHGDKTTGYGVNMWLGLSPVSRSGSLRGVWSPDWTGTGSGITIV